MNIVIVAQYFFTRDQAGSSRIAEFATRLAQDGHRVTVVTSFFDNFTRQIPAEYRRRLWCREELDGFQLLRVWSLPYLTRGAARRVIHMLSFMVMALLAAVRLGKVDIVLGTSPPLTTPLPAWVIARLKRARFIFEVRDLWPDAATELQILRPDSLVVRIGYRVERFLYRQADHILAVTPGLKRYLVERKALPADRISVVTNGISQEVAGARYDVEEERRALGFTEFFNVVQAGSMGVGVGLDVLIKAAELLRDERTIRFVLIGQGEMRPKLEEQARSAGLDNVVFIEPQPKSRIGRFLRAGDVMVMQLHAFYADCALPNRVFDYMAAGKPVITSGTGDVGHILEQAQAGIVVPPGDARALANAVLYLYRNPELRERMGVRAEAYVLEHFSWDRLYPAYRLVYTRALPGAA